LLRVVRLHHAFSQTHIPDQSVGGKKKRMNECSNNGDKSGCSRQWAEQMGKGLFEQHKQKHIVQTVYGGPFVLYNKPQQVAAKANYFVPAQDQQLPIKETSQSPQAVNYLNGIPVTIVNWYIHFEPMCPYLYKAGVRGRAGIDKSLF
jgi:hypothetical protein